ncbi:MAG: hypothetical protein ACI8Y4_002733 [Candidatus Poriferisodalaceae bacterium]
MWNVQLWSVGDTVQLCDLSAMNDAPSVCGIHSPTFTPIAGGSPTLDVRVGSGAFAGALVLEGRVTADRDGNISRVITQNYGCPSTIKISACAGDGAFSNRELSEADFTETTVEPIEVLAGQEVSVTVVISLS